MLRAADRMGLLVWSENPVYWALEFDNPKVLAKAEQQLDEEIGTSRNHAAIILWSMANETPNNDAIARSLSRRWLAARANSIPRASSPQHCWCALKITPRSLTIR